MYTISLVILYDNFIIMILSHRRIHDRHSCESIEDDETSTRVRNNECRMLKKDDFGI